MKRHSIINNACLIIALASFAYSCTQFPNLRNYEHIRDRVEDTALLIGCVIVETFVVRLPGPYTVALAYQDIDKTRNKLKMIWVKTDSSGYFALANMPNGHYSMAAVITEDMGWRFWYAPIEGELAPSLRQEDILSPTTWGPRNKDEPWIMITNQLTPNPQRPKSWIVPHEGNIHCFNYLILTMESDLRSSNLWNVRSYERIFLDGDRFLSDREYHLPSVPEYFIDKYPDSEWTPFLKKITK